MSKTLANHKVVALAVYLLGGDTRPVETEDIAVKANEIAPGRFTWRKYAHQINIETVRKRLWDAKLEAKGGLLQGTEREGWLLTEKGLAFARGLVNASSTRDLSGERLTPGEVTWRQRQRIRLLASDAYVKYFSGGIASVSKQDLEAFFMVDDYVVGVAREKRILRIRRAFEADPNLGSAVQALASLLPGGGVNAR